MLSDSPPGLGIAPLVGWGVLAALGLTAAGGAGYAVRGSVDEWTADPLSLNLPQPPTAPAAPVTMDQLTKPGSWTPLEMIERTNQNFASWQTGFRAGTQSTSANLTATPRGSSNTLLFVALGLGVVAVWAIARN